MTDHNPITIATAECFTHGQIAQEIHAFSRGYPLNYKWNLSPHSFKLSLIAGIFAPTISGVKSVLKIDPLTPITTMDDIKVYDQEGDEKMAEIMAKSVKNLTGAEIGIGTTAGIGKGGITLCNNELILSSTSEVNCDLRSDSATLILERQKSGIQQAIFMLECLLKNDLNSLNKKEVKIHKI